MRNWCLAATLSVLLASPLCAQRKATGSSDDTSNRTETTSDKSSAAPVNAVPTNSLATSRGILGFPAAPRPFPKPASKDTDAPGRLTPRYEFSGMYDYINFDPGSPFANFNNHGATGSFTYNASRTLGLVAELGWYRFKNRDVSGTPFTGSTVSYLFGPRLNLRTFDYFVPFAEFLLGGARGDSALIGSGSQNSFSTAEGGGVDMVISRNFAWRVAQWDYFMTTFSGPFLAANARQNSFRAATGFVYRWGIPSPLLLLLRTIPRWPHAP